MGSRKQKQRVVQPEAAAVDDEVLVLRARVAGDDEFAARPASRRRDSGEPNMTPDGPPTSAQTDAMSFSSSPHTRFVSDPMAPASAGKLSLGKKKHGLLTR